MTHFDRQQSISSKGARVSRSGMPTLWHYASAEMPSVIECASWSGPGSRWLRPHFHDETQITIVLAGHRTFHIEDEVLTLSAGQGLVISAGKTHTPIAISDCDTVCINLYVDGCINIAVGTFEIQYSSLSIDELLHVVQGSLPLAFKGTVLSGDHIDIRTVLAGSGKRISDIAANYQLSREGFSRWVKRELNIAPHNFRIVSRLNHARRLLRNGQSAAVAAVEAGFSDQSHLTRLFRDTFGTTPGLYRRG